MDARSVSQEPALRVNRRPSLMPHGLRERLVVGFCLMSVVPLLVLGYVTVNYVFPHLKTFGDLSLVIGLAVLIAILGFVVVRSLVLPVIRLASDARAIASGQTDRRVDIEAPGEVGELGLALNQITQRARENMVQLKQYGEQTHRLNMEINQRILALSNVLQISNLIAQSSKVEEVLNSILEKLNQMEDVPLNCLLEPVEGDLFLIQAVSGTDPARVEALRHQRIAAPWLKRLLENRQMLIIDGRHAASHERALFKQLFGVSHVICQPLICLGKPAGLLVSGNAKDEYVFQDDVIDLLKIFAKQAIIGMENDLLNKRAKELEIMDELTGLYNAGYMKTRLEEEVQRSIRYHRPCSLVVVNVDDFRYFQETYGALRGEKILKRMGELLASCVTEVDRVGRMALDEFAVILPERNKRETMEMAETIRGRLAQGLADFLHSSGETAPTVSAGVSENPIDGSTGSELFVKAAERVRAAKRMGKNKVMAV